MYTLQFFSVLWYYMHEKSTNCIPMQAHKRNTKMFYWKKPYLVLFMKQNGNTNGDLIYSVDLTEISKFPFQFPGKIQFDHIRDLSFQTISIYIVINFCVGLRTFYCIYRVESMLYIEAMLAPKAYFIWKREKEYRVLHLKNYKSERLWLETVHIWPYLGKAKMCLKGSSFSWFSKNFLHFLAVCLHFFSNKLPPLKHILALPT